MAIPAIIPNGMKMALLVSASCMASVAKQKETSATGIASGMLEGMMKRSSENFFTVSSGALNGNVTLRSSIAAARHIAAAA